MHEREHEHEFDPKNNSSPLPLIVSGFVALIFAVLLTLHFTAKHAEEQDRAFVQAKAADTAVQKQQQELNQSFLDLGLEGSAMQAHVKMVGEFRQRLDKNPTLNDQSEAIAEVVKTTKAVAKVEKSLNKFVALVKQAPTEPRTAVLVAAVQGAIDQAREETNALLEVIKKTPTEPFIRKQAEDLQQKLMKKPETLAPSAKEGANVSVVASITTANHGELPMPTYARFPEPIRKDRRRVASVFPYFPEAT